MDNVPQITDFNSICKALLEDATHVAKYSLDIKDIEDYTLLCPLFVLEAALSAYTIKHQQVEYKYKHPEKTKIHGFNIAIGYEKSIVIFHKDYPLTQNPKHIYRQPIN